jgi:arylsulfatase A-like enzyme
LEAKSNPKLAPLKKFSVAMVKGGYKMIYYAGFPALEHPYEFYDLEADPEELVDLYPQNVSAASAMKEELTEQLHLVDEPYQR